MRIKSRREFNEIKSIRLKVLQYFALVALVFLVFFPLYGLWNGLHPAKIVTDLTPDNFGWQSEEVTIKTSDGVKLSGWLVPASKNSDQVIILLHGYGADKANLLYFAEFLHDDFNLFFFDMRYFGKSGGDMTTLGRDEQKDLEAAVAYVKDKGFTKIGLMGFSFGGAVAILGAKNQDISAVVADSAYASLDSMGHIYYQNLSVLKYPLTYLTKFWGRIIFAIDADKVSPEKAARELAVPVLLIHSKSDQTIPFENALRLQQALASNPDAESLFLNEGIHGVLPADLQVEYENSVREFFKKNLGRLTRR